jgi:hypothetical protein
MALSPVAAARLADAILVVHTGIVVFVVAGAAAILIGAWRGWAWVHGFAWRLTHVVLMAFIALQAWRGALCPLTVWEQALRTRAGQPVYAGSFVAHWLSRVLFYDAPWWAFVAAYSAFALLVIGLWVWVPPQRVRRRVDSRHAR